MIIKVRWIEPYADVSIIDGATTIAIGMLDEHERAKLCAEFQEAIDEIRKRDLHNG